MSPCQYWCDDGGKDPKLCEQREENGVARSKARKADDALAELSFPAVREQPGQEVIASGPIDDESVGSRCGFMLHDNLHDERKLKEVSCEARLDVRRALSNKDQGFVRFAAPEEVT